MQPARERLVHALALAILMPLGLAPVALMALEIARLPIWP